MLARDRVSPPLTLELVLCVCGTAPVPTHCGAGPEAPAVQNGLAVLQQFAATLAVPCGDCRGHARLC